MKNDYEDIIHMSRPSPTHPRMSISDRAKIFSPFAALRGHDEAIAAKRLQRVNKVIMSEEDKAALGVILQGLGRHDTVNITHFVSDPGSDGSGGLAEGVYVLTAGEIENIDGAYGVIRINGIDIRFDDILSVNKT